MGQKRKKGDPEGSTDDKPKKPAKLNFELISDDYFSIKFLNFFDNAVKDGIKAFSAKGNRAVYWD